MKNTWILLTFFMGMTLISTSQARIIYYGDQPELINVVYDQPTIFRFPSLVKTVSSVNGFDIAPVDSTDPDYSVLSVSPKQLNFTADVLFVLDSGETIKVKLKSVQSKFPEIVDSIFDFKSKNDLVVSPKKQAVNISELELIKAMIRNDNITGYKTRQLVRTMWNFKKGLTVRLLKVYTGDYFNGYVFGIKNRTNKQIPFDIRQLQLGRPNLAVLAQIDQPQIPAKADTTTFLRIVAKPSSIYRDMSMPRGNISNTENK